MVKIKVMDEAESYFVGPFPTLTDAQRYADLYHDGIDRYVVISLRSGVDIDNNGNSIK